VFCDHRIDFSVAGIEPFGPDLAVFDGVPNYDPNRGTFVAAEFGAVPLLVVEVTSPSTRKNDLGIKVELYRRCKVPFYAIVDRHAGEDGTGVALWGYRLTADGYEEIEPGADGRLWLESVRLWLAIEEGKAVLYDASGGRIAPPEDLDQQAATMAEDRRLLVAEVAEERRLAAERDAAMAEAMQVSEEERRAANRRAEEAEKARQEAEEQRRQADEQRRQAEEQRRQADEQRRQADEQRRQAEERAAAETKARRLAEESAAASAASLLALQEEIRRLKGA
jgi:hypothetical protein